MAFFKTKGGGRDKRPDFGEDDVVIAVIGRTGSGKSNFIQIATGQEDGVGHGLGRCTNVITTVRVAFAQHVVLVDTPGFDDDSTTDQDVLSNISVWLQATYKKNPRLAGILYLQRIDDPRPPHLPILRNLTLFQKLCGGDGFRKIIFATTMWQDVERSAGIEREKGFRNEHWIAMVKGGSQTMRFENTAKSAWRILKRVIDLEKQPNAAQMPSYASALGRGVSVTEDQCRSLVLRTIHNREHRLLIEKLQGAEAQLMADYFNIILHAKLPDKDWERVLSILLKLAKYGQVYPQCYELGAVEYDTRDGKFGNFADVFKGVHDGKVICLKIMRFTSGGDGGAGIMKMYLKELMLWAHLSDRNILPFYGLYRLTGSSRLCLVSPWMGNGNLHDYAKGRTQTQRKLWLSDILDGLSYLHKKMIVHGDLKGANILISDDDRALIADFGLSYVAMASVRMASSNGGLGTIRWAAPELFNPVVDPAKPNRPTQESDIWSFGCTCYEILTSELPFPQYGHEGLVISALQLGDAFPERPKINPRGSIDDELWALMMSCWNYKPELRPACQVLRDGLTEVGICRKGDKPSAAAGSNYSFWDAVREKSNIEVDYDAVEEILLCIQESTST